MSEGVVHQTTTGPTRKNGETTSSVPPPTAPGVPHEHRADHDTHDDAGAECARETSIVTMPVRVNLVETFVLDREGRHCRDGVRYELTAPTNSPPTARGRTTPTIEPASGGTGQP